MLMSMSSSTDTTSMRTLMADLPHPGQRGGQGPWARARVHTRAGTCVHTRAGTGVGQEKGPAR